MRPSDLCASMLPFEFELTIFLAVLKSILYDRNIVLSVAFEKKY